MSFYDAIRVGASGAADTFQIERSVRISKDRGNYFSINNSSSGNTQTFTFSFWMKLGKLHNNFLPIYSHYLTGTNRCGIVHTGTSAGSAGFQYQNRQSNSHKALIDPAEKLRDHSAWYHVVFRMDTTNSTQNNRFIIYVNGREIAQDRYIGVVQNSTSVLNSATTHYIGYDGYYGSGDFYLADIHLIDGQALDASYFAETNSTTGQWVPKAYSGSYSGTSYHLKFDDNSSASALGTDSSGLGNNVTPVNFSVATGVNNDSVEDTPTNNFCTLNPLDKASTIALKNGNLQIDSVTNQNYDGVRANFGTKTGKFYWEIKFPTTGYLSAIGIARADGLIKTGSEPTYRIVLGLGSWYNTYNSGGVATYVNTTPSSDYPSVATWSGASNYSNNDVYMIAVDFDNGKMWWGKNNSWFNNSGTANPATGTDPRITFTTGNEWFPYSQEGDSSTVQQAYNFGQQGFAYTPPSGFVALSSENLPPNVPSIVRPQRFFDNLLYSGNGSTQSITGFEFKPDFVWIKMRSHDGDNHHLYDSVRGAAKSIFANTDDDEQTSDTDRLSSFTIDGFTLGNNYRVNGSGKTFVAWCWKAGGAAVSNSDGAITSSVSVNDESGFSIVSYSGNGNSTATIGHGLSKAPKWILIKCRSTDSQANWVVWHESLSDNKNVFLDQNNAEVTPSYGHITDPTSTLINVSKGSGNQTNASGQTYISYCWYEVPGYSKFGSYKADGLSDGPYVRCGFRPALIFIKNISLGQPWVLMDNKINPSNLADTRLSTSNSDGDHTSGDNYIDFLADGFKVRSGSSTDINYSTSYTNHIFMAFAEQPGEIPFDTFPNAR